MHFSAAVHAYVQALIRAYNPKTDNEHTHRTDLQNFLRKACAEMRSDIEPRQEIKDDQPHLGVPDFSFIHRTNLGTVGLLENKAIGEPLEKIIASGQVTKYRKRNENIVLTNYLDWLLLRNGKVTHSASLVKSLKGNPVPSTESIADLRSLLSAFLSETPRGIGTKQELAEQLALRCHELREFLVLEMKRQQKNDEQSALWDMYNAFQKYIDSHLTLADFAGAFSQTLGYSLFLAKLNVRPADTTITLHNVQQFIPSHFSLIKALANFLKELDGAAYLPIRHRVEEILGMMNYLVLDKLTADLSYAKTITSNDEEARLFERDPYIYFYEHFLREYDPVVRDTRGIYYTPPPVVNFIIRCTNQILRSNAFHIHGGLANSNLIQILDFAAGTGTFLLEAMIQMFEDPEIAASKTLQKALVEDHLLKNLYGFEFLVAPYTVAHLKLSQFLKDKGFPLQKPLNIYLTNTLEMKSPQGDFPFMQRLKEESVSAQRVKEMPVLVITGNPPYNVKSKNSGEIDSLTRDAYAPADEKKMNWDDYVKFIRFAHHKMESIERGIVGIITNNSFLGAITLRQMRNRLMRDFNAIYILNLHGNSLVGETAPDGRQDANVFDIRVGTAITLLVKEKRDTAECKVYYADIRSSRRIDKYKRLAAEDLSIFEPLDVELFNRRFAATRWSGRFAEPLSFFVPASDGYAEKLKTYGDFWGVTDIFTEKGSGVKTERDHITIQQTKEELDAVLNDFLRLSVAELKVRYHTDDSRDWTVAKAKADLLKHRGTDCYADIVYRPFDIRKTYYTETTRGFIGTPGAKIGRHMMRGDNYALVTSRTVYTAADEPWQDVQVTDALVEFGIMATRPGNTAPIFPLYVLRSARDDGDLFAKDKGKYVKEENLRPAFRRWLDGRYRRRYSPEQVLGYIYAVLHSPTFRTRYREFLKIDFPRVPFVEDAGEFEALAAKGWDLVNVHVMKTIPDGPKVTFPQDGSNAVEDVCYDQATQRLNINREQYFDNVPLGAWEFEIGGYRVLDKYLKERKKAGRALRLQELTHLPRVIRVLVHTLCEMQRIDGIFKCP